MTPPAPKNRARALIDALPEDRVRAVLPVLDALRTRDLDPFILAALCAPIDDEDETEAERAAVAVARAELDRGEHVSHEDILAEFG